MYKLLKDNIYFSIEVLFTDIFLSILYWNLDNQEIQNKGWNKEYMFFQVYFIYKLDYTR